MKRYYVCYYLINILIYPSAAHEATKNTAFIAWLVFFKRERIAMIFNRHFPLFAVTKIRDAVTAWVCHSSYLLTTVRVKKSLLDAIASIRYASSSSRWHHGMNKRQIDAPLRGESNTVPIVALSWPQS